MSLKIWRANTEADALDWLAVQGAADVTVEYVQDEAPVGEVVAQSLEPGTQSKDAPLTLTVSGRTVLMPPLTGLTLEGATALLQSEGLVLGEVTEGESPDAPAHTVIAQNIRPQFAGAGGNGRRPDALRRPRDDLSARTASSP